MDNIKVHNIFAAVFDKKVLDGLLKALTFSRSDLILRSKTFFKVRTLGKDQARFWGTEGTINYVKSKGFEGESVVHGFDYDGRVKSIDRANFVRILADRSNPKHLEELKKEFISHSRPDRESDPRLRDDDRNTDPFDLVIVDLYAPDPKNFPESMDIGGQTLIRAAIKNYKNVALAFDKKSIGDLVSHLKANQGSTLLSFRKSQAKKAAKFIASRTKLEANLFDKIVNKNPL